MNPVLTFVAPPPGLAPLVDFSLDKIDGADGLYAMHASLDSELRLFLLDATEVRRRAADRVGAEDDDGPADLLLELVGDVPVEAEPRLLPFDDEIAFSIHLTQRQVRYPSAARDYVIEVLKQLFDERSRRKAVPDGRARGRPAREPRR